MSSKIYCLIPYDWTLARLASHTCHDCSHVHLSRSEGADQLNLNLAEELREYDKRLRIKGVLRIRRRLGIHGLSCHVGEELAIAKRLKEPWAEVMLSHIQPHRHEREEQDAAA